MAGLLALSPIGSIGGSMVHVLFVLAMIVVVTLLGSRRGTI